MKVSSMKKLLAATVISLALADSASDVYANALLFSAVDFDQSTNLYTYNYAIQNDTSSTIWNVDILVGNVALVLSLVCSLA